MVALRCSRPGRGPDALSSEAGQRFGLGFPGSGPIRGWAPMPRVSLWPRQSAACHCPRQLMSASHAVLIVSRARNCSRDCSAEAWIGTHPLDDDSSWRYPRPNWLMTRTRSTVPPVL
jgi:hypothetical protein